MGKTDYYRQTVQEVATDLSVDIGRGLGKSEVATRLDHYGRNRIEATKKLNPIKLFFNQFNDVLIIILLFAALVSLGLSFIDSSHQSISTASQQCVSKDVNSPCQVINNVSKGSTESLLIFTIVIAIAVVGFLNEYKAERTVEALSKLVGHKARVRRSGKVIDVDSIDLVPGDVVLLEAGNKIPADIRLTTSKGLMVNESSLTGESIPVSKNTFPIDETVTLGDQKNLVFSGTIIVAGKAEGIVIKTAQSTEIGKIAHLVAGVEEEMTPMQKKLDDLGRRLGAIILAISIVVFVVIFFLNDELANQEFTERLIFSFTAAVALAVAAIPEGLAFVVRISLALGARRMAAKNALVRKLSAVEALGSTDVICSDKTGTLTRGEMTVRKIWFNGNDFEISGSGYEITGEFTSGGKSIDVKELFPLLRIGGLNNNAFLKDGIILGDPTEGALLVSAAKAGLKHETLNNAFLRVDEIPFSSDRKMMTTVHRFKRGYLVAVKGAPDILLEKCDRLYIDGKVKKLNKTYKEIIRNNNKKMASEALRVLGFAYKEVKTQPKGKSTEAKLIFLGLQAMMDPPRVEVADVIHRINTEAGMRVIMITGDYIDTAKAVSQEIGIEGEAITGVELDELTQEEFEDRVERIAVYARVNPEHKIRIIRALKKHGHQVAMTGDGVNDAPAIKAADIGIAMGITGTDASKEASDMILLDDQFLTIVGAIEEGRGIFDNVRKFVNYLLSANIAEVITILGGVVLMGRLVLTAVHLLFINIVTDGLPAVALGSDPSEKGIMRFKPYRFQEVIINRRIWWEMLIFGLLMSSILLSHYWWIAFHQDESSRAVAVAFTSMVVYEMVRLIGIRSGYKIKWFSNPWLSIAILASLGLQLVVIYTPWLSELFNISPIHGIDWLIILSASLGLLISMKVVNRVLDKIFVQTSTLNA